MSKKITFILFFLIGAILATAQPGRRQKLTQLEAGPADTVRKGYIPLTDTAGNLRYARYVAHLNSCITYTPGPFETNPFYWSKFVRKCGTDSMFYIDYTGLVKPINSGAKTVLPTVPNTEIVIGTGSPGYTRALFAGFTSSGMDVWGGKPYNLLNTTTGTRNSWEFRNDSTTAFTSSLGTPYGHYVRGKPLYYFKEVFFFGDISNSADFNAEFNLINVITAGSKLTGVRHGTTSETTRKIVLQNVGSNDLIIENESTASTAANRFAIGSNYTLQPGKSIAFWYHRGSVNRWKFYEPQQTGAGGGITNLNSLTGATQTFATGTSGTDFNISSSGSTHTFNLPAASLLDAGKVTTGAQSFAGIKTFQDDINTNGDLWVRGGQLEVGQSSTTPGVININGATSGAVQIAVPSVVPGGGYALTLPANDGDAGQVLQTNGSGVTTWANGSTLVFEYSTAQTNTALVIPAGAKSFDVFAVGGGGGGGSGRRGATSTARGGGGGGRAGSVSIGTFAVADMVGNLSITVGAGGAGGAAVTTDDTNGGTGVNGGPSIVSNNSITLVHAARGGNGSGGTTTGGSGGASIQGGFWFQPQPATSGGTGGATSTTASENNTPGSGAGGAGISAANAAGTGGSCLLYYYAQRTGGSGGSGGSSGGAGTPPSGGVKVGGGGGGGGSQVSGPGGNGGNGGAGGGGGGGGAASLNGFNSGAGGNGGDGYVRIIFYF